MKGYPNWFKGFIITTMTVLFLSGFLLTPTTLDLRLEWDMPWRLTADQRLYTVAAHVLFSYVMLCLFGAIWRIHIIVGIKQKENLYSGLALTGTLIVLAITGVGIFYFGNDMASIISSVTHLLLGVIILFIFLYHIIFGKR